SGWHMCPTRTSSSTFTRGSAAKSVTRAPGGGGSLPARERRTNRLRLAAGGLRGAAGAVLPPTGLVQLVSVMYVGFVIAQVRAVFGAGVAARPLFRWPVFLTIAALASLAGAPYRRGSARR